MSTVNLQVTEEQICDAVRAIVDEEMPDAVRMAVLSHAESMIKDAVTARIGPVIDAVLANEQFVTGRWDDHKTPIDQLVKRAVSSYLDQRVFLYSQTSDLPSMRLHNTSSSGPSRLEAFLRFSIERFCDEHLNTKLEATAQAFLNERGGIEQVAREQMSKLLKEKFKL